MDSTVPSTTVIHFENDSSIHKLNGFNTIIWCHAASLRHGFVTGNDVYYKNVHGVVGGIMAFK
jgi:hypothetical protein